VYLILEKEEEKEMENLLRLIGNSRISSHGYSTLLLFRELLTLTALKIG